MAYFSHLKVGSPIYESIQSVGGFLTREHFLASSLHRSMALPASAQEFRRALPSKARQKQRKLLGTLGDSVRVVCYRAAEEVETICRDVEAIARKTYQRGLGAGFVDNDEARQRMHIAAARGWLRAFLLYFGTRPAAFWIGTVYSGKLYSDYMGYDPELAERSPGIFLVTKAIEEICDRRSEWGALEIDWGFGDAQYKEMLGTCEWKEASVHIFAPTIRGVALNAVRTPGAYVEHVSKDFLGRSSVASWVKKRWRQRLARA
jgi:CelD/BcsL family acetyltransferase involved in cellulose biosynthesis